MEADWISYPHIVMIVTATAAGTAARMLTIKADYRQYPSYPNGYLIHFVTGFVAAALGAVAIPALMTKNFVAVTFLSLALQQFRDVRKVEDESLKNLEKTEYTFRGTAYIDGISKTFEARNYLSFLVALLTAIAMQAVSADVEWINVVAGLAVGAITFYLLKRFSKGKTIGDIADVKQGKIEIRETDLYVDGIFISHLLGTDDAVKRYREEGLAVVIYPRERQFSILLDHFGQRQAALFEATRAIGLKRQQFIRRDFDNGRVVITLVPIIRDLDRLILAVQKTPLLESTKKTKRVKETHLTES